MFPYLADIYTPILIVIGGMFGYLAILRKSRRLNDIEYEAEIRQRAWDLERDQFRTSLLRSSLEVQAHLREAIFRAKNPPNTPTNGMELQANLQVASKLLQAQIDQLLAQNPVDDENLERMNEMLHQRQVRLKTIPSAQSGGEK
ncbi:MAG: hypothetical protein EOO27_35810 [Comamonadaceae bacterium]|nr:MAG: hypothetical protein EOO27_35810 [Comamonadaceae bacterium]